MLQWPLLASLPIILALAGHGWGQRTLFVKSDTAQPPVPYTSINGEVPNIARSDHVTIKITGYPGDWVFLFCRAYINTDALQGEALYEAKTITYIHPWFGPGAWNGADLVAVGLGAESSNPIPSNVPVAIEPLRIRNMIAEAVGFGPNLPLMRDLVKAYCQGIYLGETEVIWSGAPINWSAPAPALTRNNVLATALWGPLVVETNTEFELEKLIRQAMREQHLVTFGVFPSEDLVDFLIGQAATLDLNLAIQAVVVSSLTGRAYQLPANWSQSRGLDCLEPSIGGGDPIPPTTDILEPMVIPVLLGFPATGTLARPVATGLPSPFPAWAFVGTPGEPITFALPQLAGADATVDAIFPSALGGTVSAPASLEPGLVFDIEATVSIPQDAAMGCVEFMQSLQGTSIGLLGEIPFGWGTGVFFVPMPRITP